MTVHIWRIPLARGDHNKYFCDYVEDGTHPVAWTRLSTSARIKAPTYKFHHLYIIGMFEFGSVMTGGAAAVSNHSMGALIGNPFVAAIIITILAIFITSSVGVEHWRDRVKSSIYILISSCLTIFAHYYCIRKTNNTVDTGIVDTLKVGGDAVKPRGIQDLMDDINTDLSNI